VDEKGARMTLDEVMGELRRYHQAARRLAEDPRAPRLAKYYSGCASAYMDAILLLSRVEMPPPSNQNWDQP